MSKSARASAHACLQVDGVGLGAMAQAAKMGAIDPLKMATWSAGEPVPFSFLVETFEVRLHGLEHPLLYIISKSVKQ